MTKSSPWISRKLAGAEAGEHRELLKRSMPHSPQHQRRLLLCTTLPHQKGRSGRAVLLCRSRTWQISLPGEHGTALQRSLLPGHPTRRTRSRRKASIARARGVHQGSCQRITTVPPLSRKGLKCFCKPSMRLWTDNSFPASIFPLIK